MYGAVILYCFPCLMAAAGTHLQSVVRLDGDQFPPIGHQTNELLILLIQNLIPMAGSGGGGGS
jgi:hypothetical protein